MKKKNSHRSLNTKNLPKTISKSIVNKLGMLIGFIMPVALFISYSMDVNFFSITKIISIFVLIISIAAYLKGEVIYTHPKLVQKGNTSKFSFSLKKGTVQMVLSITIIIIFTYMGQVIYKVIG